MISDKLRLQPLRPDDEEAEWCEVAIDASLPSFERVDQARLVPASEHYPPEQVPCYTDPVLHEASHG